jgi:hypothetical protein
MRQRKFGKSAVRSLTELTDTIEWMTGTPPKSGYYLIAWVNPAVVEHISVSEAWYNPDSIIPWWWSRGYTGEPRRGINAAMTKEVISWAPMPNPPKIVK